MKYVIFFALVMTIRAYSQKIYEFDYFLYYDQTVLVNTKESSVDGSNTKYIEREKIQLINSRDNSYYATLVEKDSLNYNLQLRDYRGLSFELYLNKKNFQRAEIIKVPCKFISQTQKPLKYQIKNYKFKRGIDTIVNNTNLLTYELISKSAKRARRKKLGTIKYVIDTMHTEFSPQLIFQPAMQFGKKDIHFPKVC